MAGSVRRKRSPIVTPRAKAKSAYPKGTMPKTPKLAGENRSALTTLTGLAHQTAMRLTVTSGVGLTVASVPEGLPLLATTAQRASARRLATRGALVRNPRTIEALGRVDTLCFDETGTLTVGEIALQRVSDGEHDDPVDRLGRRTRAYWPRHCGPAPTGRGTSTTCPTPPTGPCLPGARQRGSAPTTARPPWKPLDDLPFDPDHGFHAALGSSGSHVCLSVKGAPEEVLARAARWQTDDGPLPIEGGRRRRLHEEVQRLAGLGLRVLAVAERRLAQPGAPPPAQPAGGAKRGGEIALDEEEVKDLRQTAGAIAREVGILNGHRVLTGTELGGMDDAVLDEVIADVSVFARVTPTDKVRVVQALQRADRVVAMTGDGANDAPAIRLAHTGIALGSQGSGTAREAADLVVVDDRMETILDAIVEGRSMWMSVRDALGILVGGNLGEVAFSLATTALTGASRWVAGSSSWSTC